MKTMAAFIILINLFVLSSACSEAHAYTYATGVEWTGSYDSSNNRTRMENALGSPDDTFLSLDGGSAIFTFGTQFNTEASVIEVTYGNRHNWIEYADVYVGTGQPTFSFDNLYSLGTITNDNATNTVDLSTLDSGPFDFLLLVDTTSDYGGHPGDGFDVDAVGVTAATPIPGAIWILSSGLIGLVSIRRVFNDA